MFARRWILSQACRIPHAGTRSSGARAIHRFSPLIRDFVGTLRKQQPCFAVSPERIQILTEPAQFYTKLLSMIETAERRIFISSLYIGSEELELIEALRLALQRSANLEVVLQLDLNRSTRPGKSSTAHILLPLLREFPERVHVSLFRSPKLSGIMARFVPPRFNEGWGTWHAKIYGADNDVLISGANLNKSYFTDRRDRYIHFTSQPDLADYCSSFLRVVSSFSFSLLPQQPPESVARYSYHHDDYTLAWPKANTHPHHIQELAEATFKSFHKSYTDTQSINTQNKTESGGERASNANNVLLFPLIQAGQFNVREEEFSLSNLFRHLLAAASGSAKQSESRRRPLVDLTSGYFSLYKPYRDLILSGDAFDCRIVAASPKVRKFFRNWSASPASTFLSSNSVTLFVRRTGSMVLAAYQDVSPRATPTSNSNSLKRLARQGEIGLAPQALL
ncbi:hypothetical protein HGRIS_012689 [Hohenbuehelia grisea]|uniref:CDP-diacylglycerol--glycerol-3-phosphate 3-phosphatidyltransferase n=1 Tax=Hohenbuehelia grisea TaxID=104357 RepID=A0ABR3IT44_9AGAR